MTSYRIKVNHHQKGVSYVANVKLPNDGGKLYRALPTKQDANKFVEKVLAATQEATQKNLYGDKLRCYINEALADCYPPATGGGLKRKTDPYIREITAPNGRTTYIIEREVNGEWYHYEVYTRDTAQMRASMIRKLEQAQPAKSLSNRKYPLPKALHSDPLAGHGIDDQMKFTFMNTFTDAIKAARRGLTEQELSSLKISASTGGWPCPTFRPCWAALLANITGAKIEAKEAA